MIRILLQALALCLCITPAAGGVTAWRFGSVAYPDAAATAGTRLALTSAEIKSDTLILRVGIQTTPGGVGALALAAVTEKDVTLKFSGTKRLLACISLDKRWPKEVAATTARGEVLTATMKFFAPPGLAEKQMFLRVAGYGHIAFRCADGAPFSPPDLAQTPERWDLEGMFEASTAGFENLRMELGTMRLWEGKLTFALSFRNGGRFPFRMRGGPAGGDAILVSAEREFFRKPVVTGAIEKHIAPDDDWRPDETVTGTVTFPLPHGHGLSRLWFAYPGFADVPLIFDESLHRWRVETEALARRGVPPVRQRARAEEGLFASVGDFWQTISRHLDERKFATAAAHFQAPAECALLRNIEKVPLAEIDVRPSPAQRLMLQGDELVGVRMEVRFRFRGEPAHHSFLLFGGCRMKRVAEAPGWRVESLTLDLAPPWAQGYTAFGESRHFLIFYRPEGGQEAHAVSTLEQLEASWHTITQTGLKLDDRYAAFLCMAPEDHKLLTGDRGVSSAQASVGGMARDEGDEFRIYNTAVYVSPEIFLGPSKLQKKRRLQTALDHEMVHAALAPWSRTWMPGWMVEGAAVHLSGERRGDRAMLADAMASGLTLRSLTETGALRDPKGDLMRLDLQYQLASEAVAVISANWGTSKLMELYQAYALEYPEPWHGPYGVDYADETGGGKRRARLDLTQKLLKRILGTSIEELEKAVHARLRH